MCTCARLFSILSFLMYSVIMTAVFIRYCLYFLGRGDVMPPSWLLLVPLLLISLQFSTTKFSIPLPRMWWLFTCLSALFQFFRSFLHVSVFLSFSFSSQSTSLLLCRLSFSSSFSLSSFLSFWSCPFIFPFFIPDLLILPVAPGATARKRTVLRCLQEAVREEEQLYTRWDEMASQFS